MVAHRENSAILNCCIGTSENTHYRKFEGAHVNIFANCGIIDTRLVDARREFEINAEGSFYGIDRLGQEAS
jgi:hypothetical protein